jgi:hypothetical protein
MDEKTLHISQIVSRSDIKETIFDPSIVKFPSFSNIIPVDVARMRDIVEVSELDDKPEFEELAWLADRAVFLRPIKGGAQSVMQRIEIVKNLDDVQMEELEAYMAQVTSYGVQESLTVRCNGCGAEKTSEVVIDALSFLPSYG